MTERSSRAYHFLGRAYMAVAYRLLRPHIMSVLDEIAARWRFEGSCEDEDVPDCENCSHHGHCPYEPQVTYEPPPGYMLVRPGPPPHPWEIN